MFHFYNINRIIIFLLLRTKTVLMIDTGDLLVLISVVINFLFNNLLKFL
jgi:hypothetical protein